VSVTEPRRTRYERSLRPGVGQDVVEPNAEPSDLLREPVNGYVGSIQLFACFLARGEQKNQSGDEFAVGGDVDSFLGTKASVKRRSGSLISA
jgi:hypothetical protein